MNPLVQELFLAFRNVVRQRRRSSIAVAAVAFGITTLLLAGGFIEWNLMGMRETTIGSRLGHIQVARPGYFQIGQSEPFAYLLPQNSADREAIEKLPGVRLSGARMSFGGLISHGESTLSFIGEGVEPEKEATLSSTLLIARGSGLSGAEPKGIIMGLGLAANLGVDVGDRVVLLANTRAGGINAVECTVLGLFSTVSKAYDDSALQMPIATARELLRVSGSHVWVLLLEKTEDTQAVLASLRSSLADRSLEFVPWSDLADFYNKTVVLFRKQVGVIEVIIGMIIVLSIANTLMMNVVERTGEIGTAMAVGVKRAKIMRLFLLEGLLLGIVGGALGLVLGSIAAAIISMIGIPMPPPPGMARGYTAEILVNASLLLNAALLAAGTTLLASLYPAWKASRMIIVDALRFNR
ncbi:MAG: ABC transporter permease [Candidatus Accumulibacter sp.]|uniref:ABC transporter permease n=1 Tax=Accumulibacter sp. TaxID=2053492 RepID=UPI0019FDED7B|nr:FtsX-like permease family protein [Accumulibacter sp.]MBE2259181.1 ABC transporter permease [Paracoccaceae bacterium]MCB1941863.1 ABC transporter permease [Accumulibacter sp.]MCP5248062.1 ABC transporter permease [Accumulibacter sp.]